MILTKIKKTKEDYNIKIRQHILNCVVLFYIHKSTIFDIEYTTTLFWGDSMKIKKGDIVGRISYGKDVFFIVDNILKTEVGLVFSKVLEHAGVFKRNTEGTNAFIKFAESVK